MPETRPRQLVRLRAASQARTCYVSQGHTVLATDKDGLITDKTAHGLFVHQTRLLSLYRYGIRGISSGSMGGTGGAGAGRRDSGTVPQPVALSNVDQHTWLGYYIASPPGVFIERDLGSGQVPDAAQQTIELRVSRFVGEGVHEDLDWTNYTRQPVRFTFDIELAADFADQIEPEIHELHHDGWLAAIVDWLAEAPARRQITAQVRTLRDGVAQLRFDYRARHRYRNQSESGLARIHRGLVVQVSVPRLSEPGGLPDATTAARLFEPAPPGLPARRAGLPSHRITFNIHLPPRGRWHCCVDMIPLVNGKPLTPRYSCHSFVPTDHEYDRKRIAFMRSTTKFRTSENCGGISLAPLVTAALEQAELDLAALRLYDLDPPEPGENIGAPALRAAPPRTSGSESRATLLHGSEGRGAADGWTMAAGLPLYVALFGRDVLTAAWQASMASPTMMRGALPVLATRQGKVINHWRDEEPGKMLHEAHTGPRATLNYNPRSRYYGSITTSAFFPVALSELWHWTGDRELVGSLIDPALRALRWLDERADLDGDGFYEYLSRSEHGVKHQAWKDSGDSMVYEDGSHAQPPIATCEEQGFVYAAKLQMAEVLWRFGEKDLARRFFRDARELKKRFNDEKRGFWMNDEGFYAMALDAHKRPLRSISSNPGHCLATAIVDRDRAAIVADRLMAPELFSGWGVRTLSADHPAYNPFSYHCGTVWPVEQATFSIGFYRFGLHERLHELSKAQFEAASLFDFYRMPECFSGHARDQDHPFPAFYPRANAPQAWSASALFCHVQAMLGLYPYAPLKMLVLDPQLPDWLPELIVENLHVGDAAVTIRFYRNDDGATAYRILDKRGTLHVLRQPSPWSLTATMGERVTDALVSLLPGR